MKRARCAAALALALVTLGSLATSGGYAWYLRSDRYRSKCTARLTAALGLPCDIGRVVPRSRHCREFDDVAVWLPDRRDKVVACQRALLTKLNADATPQAYEMVLLGGACEISTRTWLHDDYRRVVESGLRPGFADGGPRQVTFSDMDLRFERDDFKAALADAAGTIIFDSRQQGHAAVYCRSLNGFSSPEPITLAMRFSPLDGRARIDDLTLHIPDLPLSVLELNGLIGAPIQTGHFTGQLAYSEVDDRRRTTLSGHCRELSLAECTAPFAPPGWHGSGNDVELQELTLVDGRPTRLRFSGVLSGMLLGDVLAPWGLRTAGGQMVLRVGVGELSPQGIDYLVASGTCENISLRTLSEPWDVGKISGTATLVITDLTIRDNRLASLEAEFRVENGPEPKWVEGRLVTTLLGNILGLGLPSILPRQIEYVQLGLRLEVHDEVLYVFGTHGDSGKTILTARIMDQEVPLVWEPEQGRDLGNWFDGLRADAAACLKPLQAAPPRQAWEAVSTLRRGLRATGTTPASEPTGTP